MKLCKDCKHVVLHKNCPQTLSLCKHPIVSLAYKSKVTGPQPTETYCDTERTLFLGRCGYFAKYFEAKNENSPTI